jgi:hypothetical protein
MIDGVDLAARSCAGAGATGTPVTDHGCKTLAEETDREGSAIGAATAVPAIDAASGRVIPSTAARVTDRQEVRTAGGIPITMTGASASPPVTLSRVLGPGRGMPERTTLDGSRAMRSGFPSPGKAEGGKAFDERDDANHR